MKKIASPRRGSKKKPAEVAKPESLGPFEALNLLTEQVEADLLDGKPTEATITEYIKLLQTRKEFDTSRPKSVAVYWQDPKWFDPLKEDEIEPAA